MGRAFLYGVGGGKSAQELYRVQQIISNDECELVVVTEKNNELQLGQRYFITQSIDEDECILAFSEIYDAV